MIQALIFDFDGLIIETEEPILQSWQEFYRQQGSELTLDEWAAIIGTAETQFDPYTDLENKIGRRLDWQVLAPLRLQRETELIAVQPVLPGVMDYLDQARDLGLKLAVASSSPRTWVYGHLARVGLLERFDCIRVQEDVAQSKPEPDLYLAAAACLGVSPAQAVAFEDSPNGILAAKRAGMYCVAVPTDLTRQLVINHADLRLDSLADLPLEELLKRLEK